jgi:hypothetical protein
MLQKPSPPSNRRATFRIKVCTTFVIHVADDATMPDSATSLPASHRHTPIAVDVADETPLHQ